MKLRRTQRWGWVMVGGIAMAAPVARADEKKPALTAKQSAVLESMPRPPSESGGLGGFGSSGGNSELRKQSEELALENQIADLKLKRELAQVTAESERLSRQAELLNKRTALHDAELRAKLDGELAEARAKIERLRTANDLAAAELSSKKREMEQREAELRMKTSEMQAQRAELDLQLAKINTELDLREKRDHWKNRVNGDIAYAKEPFQNGVLTVTDRRIALNGIISPETADHISERIDYFNNQSRELPIFIVIDRSPGGSVEAGYKILKAMQGSPAPVYVVVKSFAASMAATITTLARRSFAYPNAIILHHQMSGIAMGNMTEHREQLKEREEWWKRLAAPVAKKMGIGLDEFVKRMYQQRSTGDWREFGDGAKRLKWVDEVVETVREESYVKNPDAPPAPSLMPLLPFGPTVPRHAEVPAASTMEQVDGQGHHYMALPRLDPIDCWYLYDPDGYYRQMP